MIVALISVVGFLIKFRSLFALCSRLRLQGDVRSGSCLARYERHEALRCFVDGRFFLFCTSEDVTSLAHNSIKILQME